MSLHFEAIPYFSKILTEALRIERLKDSGAWAPFWLGFSIASGYLLIHCLLDGFFVATWGFPEGTEPLWRRAVWWPDLVNATLLGYIPAGYVGQAFFPYN